jgi:hypothetical protein
MLAQIQLYFNPSEYFVGLTDLWPLIVVFLLTTISKKRIRRLLKRLRKNLARAFYSVMLSLRFYAVLVFLRHWG